jgi:hypothetical protein
LHLPSRTFLPAKIRNKAAIQLEQTRKNAFNFTAALPDSAQAYCGESAILVSETLRSCQPIIKSGV